MGLSPIIVIGCGGSGGKVVLNLRKRLQDELRRRNWTGGFPDAWQMKWIDVPSVQESHPEYGPGLKSADYIPLAPSMSFRDVDNALVTAAGSDRERLVGWRPSPDLELPVDKGAGQMRAVGRAVALTRPALIADAIRVATNKIAGGAAQLAQLGAFLSGDDQAADEEVGKPLVVVVSSLAGGTGSGIYLDVCEIVRRGFPNLNQSVLAVLFTAEVFAGVKLDGGMAPNTAASFAELGAGVLSGGSSTEPLLGPLGARAVDSTSGPNATYVVGLSPMGGGKSLESASDCYRAVTETLLATMINEDFAGSFAMYQLVNFYNAVSVNERGTRWPMLNQPTGTNLPVLCGYVSSFGSARLSVGSARFGDWAIDRMSRAAIDYVTDGWRERGLDLLDPAQRDAASDQQIVDFLVERDRSAFIDACGLWEENEPDGTPHDQVQDGIMSTSQLARIRDEFQQSLQTALAGGPNANGAQWTNLIEQLLDSRKAVFDSLVESTVNTKRDEFAAEVVGRVSAATSDWLSRYGLPVTQGLVARVIAQCDAAVDQLRNEQAEARAAAGRDARSHIAGAFSPLGNGQCAANSEFVARALSMAMGPLAWRAMEVRAEKAAELLEMTLQRVLEPLRAELTKVGDALLHPDVVEQVSTWPDGSGVGDLYRPPASEFCLLDVTEWDDQYRRLLSRTEPGSADEARNVMLAGGFDHGPVGSRKQMGNAIELSGSHSWWTRDGQSATVSVRLEPDEIRDRVRIWMSDTSHPFGRFLGTGLSEYLSDKGEGVNHRKRLDRLRTQLAGALAMAKPLFDIDGAVMQNVHTQASLEIETLAEKFPFDQAHPARPIVDEALTGLHQEAPFREANNDGIESVLVLSYLVSGVQPGAVKSLYGPIGQQWQEAVRKPPAERASYIRSLSMYRRARLITEAMPLPGISIEKIMRGWYLGRLLGVVTNPDEDEPMHIWSRVAGEPRATSLPWPLLRHGSQASLHRKSHRIELLPALLEHFGLATMLLGRDSTILDGYQALFDLGDGAEDHIETWIESGEGPVGQAVTPMLRAVDAVGRKDELVSAFSSLISSLDDRFAEGERLLTSPHFSEFAQIPYGWELIPRQRDVLRELVRLASSVAADGGGWD